MAAQNAWNALAVPGYLADFARNDPAFIFGLPGKTDPNSAGAIDRFVREFLHGVVGSNIPAGPDGVGGAAKVFVTALRTAVGTAGVEQIARNEGIIELGGLRYTGAAVGPNLQNVVVGNALIAPSFQQLLNWKAAASDFDGAVAMAAVPYGVNPALAAVHAHNVFGVLLARGRIGTGGGWHAAFTENRVRQGFPHVFGHPWNPPGFVVPGVDQSVIRKGPGRGRKQSTTRQRRRSGRSQRRSFRRPY